MSSMGISCSAMGAWSHRILLYQEGYYPDNQVQKHSLSFPLTDKLFTPAVTVFSLLMFQGGIVLFQLMDTYGPSGTSLLIIACFETIVVAWVYGESRHRPQLSLLGAVHYFSTQKSMTN